MANSRNVQNRLQKFVNIKSTVVYPPIDTYKFNFKKQFSQSKLAGQEDYYLSFARLVDLKRVKDIVRAFQQMPNKKLVVASGGPEFDKIKEMSQDYKNIEILGFVSDELLAKLVGNCIANIYIPLNEDFGMTPLEAAAVGKPTIGVNSGGLKETIIHEQTGYLILEKYELGDIINAVEWLDTGRAIQMRESCIQQAEKFKC